MAGKLTKPLIAILLTIAATPAGAYHYATAADMKPLADLKLVETNPTLVDPSDSNKTAWRLTDEGKKAAAENGANQGNGGNQEPTTTADQAGNQQGTASASSPSFKLVKMAPPPSRRVGADSVEGSKYPIHQMEIGDAFFIPIEGDLKVQSKSYGSLVTNANKRYSTGQDRRRFTTRTYADGAAFGDEFKGKQGMGVFRVEPPADKPAATTTESAPANNGTNDGFGGTQTA